MATQLKSVSKKKTKANQQATQIKQYVNQQLEKTRRQVKTTDLIGGILTIFAFAICFLLAVAVWDAWISPLSVLGRWLCLIILLGVSLGYAAVVILPLFLRRINTEYAAMMIEEAKPSFKNSLLNYVSLRNKNQKVRPAIFDAVSRQAATDLASVPSDATVDRSKLIRLGFVLIGLVLFAICYQMLSPKDPLQTIARVLAPGAKIAQPAVVKISDVLPGDHGIFFGDDLDISAVVKGRHQPDDVKVEFSTLDGQLVDQVTGMQLDESGRTYVTKIRNVQQSMRYRVVARDGASPFFDVQVRPNPTIAVESVTLRPPSYTKLPERTIVGTGNIDALEGTDVTINAVANLPIKLAYIELLEEIVDGDARNQAGRPSRYKELRELEMKSDGKTASARITAKMNASRKKPFATHYQIRFISEDDDRNEKPNIYPIRVTPDLAPEVVITNPADNDVTVPENGALPIDIDANDLDFEIASVDFHLDYRGGTKRLDQQLQLNSINQNQRVSARYMLKPSELGLKAGDKALFFATASDNRTSPQSGLPDPNISRTDNFTLTIGEPQEDNQETKKDDAGQDEKQQEKNEKDDPAQKDENSEGSESGDPESGQGESSDSDSNDENSEGSKNEKGEGQDGGDSDSEGNRENDNSQGSENTSSESQDGSEEKGEGDSGEASENEGAGGSGNEASESENQPGQNQQGSSQSNEGSDNEGNPGDDSSGSDDASSSENPGGNDGQNPGQSSDGSPGEGDGQQDNQLANGQTEKLNENASEGEQFKKLQELLDQTENQEQQNDGGGDSQSQESDSTTDNNQQNQDSGTGQSSENQQPSEGSNSEGSNSEGSNSDGSNSDGSNSDGSNSDGANSDPSDNRQPGDSGSSENSGDPNSENSANNERSQTGDGSDSNPSQEDNKSADASSSDAGNQQENQTGENSNQDSTGSTQTTEQSRDQGSQSNDPQSNQENPPQGTNSQKSDSSNQQSSDNSDQSNEGASQDSNQTSSSQSNQSSDSQGDPGSQQSPEGSSSDDSADSRESQGLSPSSDSGQESSSGQDGQPQEDGNEKSSEGSGNNQSSDSQSSEQSQSSSKGDSQGSATGQGNQSGNQKPNESNATSAASGAGGSGGNLATETIQEEKENLDHSKKATDLILSKLEEQQFNPDDKLLEEMNWSKEDLNNFLRRWKEMKRQAEMGDSKAKAKYERALKSLGLRPNEKRQNVKQFDEEIKGLNEDSAVIQPPPHLAPDFNATLRDLNRARND